MFERNSGAGKAAVFGLGAALLLGGCEKKDLSAALPDKNAGNPVPEHVADTANSNPLSALNFSTTRQSASNYSMTAAESAALAAFKAFNFEKQYFRDVNPQSIQAALNASGYLRADEKISVDGSWGTVSVNARALVASRARIGHSYDGREFPAALQGLVKLNDVREGEASLSLGAGGEDVRLVQRMLKEAGYSLNPDGDFGTLTSGAVKAFQGREGLPQNGSVDAQTLKRLEQRAGRFPADRAVKEVNVSEQLSTVLDAIRAGTLEVGKDARGEHVKLLQQLLANAGYKIETTGLFANKTFDCVIQFQRDHGLVGTGVISTRTLAALYDYTAVNEPNSLKSGLYRELLPVCSGRKTVFGTVEGSDVQAARALMRLAGYSVEAADFVGPNFTDNVKRLQADSGLKQTGLFDHDAARAAWNKAFPGR